MRMASSARARSARKQTGRRSCRAQGTEPWALFPESVIRRSSTPLDWVPMWKSVGSPVIKKIPQVAVFQQDLGSCQSLVLPFLVRHDEQFDRTVTRNLIQVLYSVTSSPPRRLSCRRRRGRRAHRSLRRARTATPRPVQRPRGRGAVCEARRSRPLSRAHPVSPSGPAPRYMAVSRPRASNHPFIKSIADCAAPGV